MCHLSLAIVSRIPLDASANTDIYTDPQTAGHIYTHSNADCDADEPTSGHADADCYTDFNSYANADADP